MLLLIIGCLLLVLILLPWLNQYLPIWFCTNLGWHVIPENIGFDGASFTGRCSRCHELVIQDSQGNWF